MTRFPDIAKDYALKRSAKSSDKFAAVIGCQVKISYNDMGNRHVVCIRQPKRVMPVAVFYYARDGHETGAFEPLSQITVNFRNANRPKAALTVDPLPMKNLSGPCADSKSSVNLHESKSPAKPPDSKNDNGALTIDESPSGSDAYRSAKGLFFELAPSQGSEFRATVSNNHNAGKGSAAFHSALRTK